jgi:spore photoproduct lyase
LYTTADYSQKLESFIPNTLFRFLEDDTQKFILEISQRFQFTYQEFRQLVEMSRDLHMWGELSIQAWWKKNIKIEIHRKNKEKALLLFKSYVIDLKKSAKQYPAEGPERPKKREKGKIVVEKSTKNIFGSCPVASEKTVCCNLKTIDAVENCIFGCSYCTIQTFYRDKTVFDDSLAEKLSGIKLDPKRHYHIGTGQSSDSLAWGNKNGNLDDLFRFANNNPNILLEFKTKSNNISYFLEKNVPPNIVCSWSLNPQVIIDNEEHFTAGLDERLYAARVVADKGVKVAFHFHPIVYYSEWQTAYPEIAGSVQNMFNPDEVLFISFGSVTFIKPVLKKIRKLGFPTKITQMELVTDPHGKMTYPDDIKINKFKTMYQAFSGWHKKVFFYLCMEKASLWEQSLGYVYPDNDTFEKDMLNKCFAKISPGINNRLPSHISVSP